MALRVISGTARGRKLKMVPGDSTRPVMDRVKEALFNILGPWVRGSRWMDLFAGTGGIGIEALSRGAEYCLFLDMAGVAIRTIHENLAITNLAGSADVIRADAFAYLRSDIPEEVFGVIYIAPPQYKGMWRSALELVDGQPGWLYPDGVVVVQIDPHEYEPVDLEHLVLFDQRTYGNTLLCFYERPGE